MIRRSHSIRPAFTLVELLVVIGIIALLAAISIAAVFAVQTAQKKSDTEATLNKVDTLLQRKLKMIQEQINDDAKNNRAEWPTVFTNCGSNPDVAKAVMFYGRSKQQLPMSITEGKTAFTVAGHIYLPSPIFAAQPPNADVSPDCSATCLYLALLPLGIEGLEQQVGDSSVGKCFKDSYGNPISFIRWAYDGNNGELNAPPYTKTPAVDPYDPASKASAVLTASWPQLILNTPTWPGNATAYPPANYTAARKNHTSTALSAGPNVDFDLFPGNAGGIFANSDNLYSFRLRREGTKGD